MSDKLQFVVAFGSGRVAETSDKLKFVGHFQRHFALLPSLPAVSPQPAHQNLWKPGMSYGFGVDEVVCGLKIEVRIIRKFARHSEIWTWFDLLPGVQAYK